MKFNLKYLVLPFSIMVCISGNYSNASENGNTSDHNSYEEYEQYYNDEIDFQVNEEIKKRIENIKDLMTDGQFDKFNEEQKQKYLDLMNMYTKEDFFLTNKQYDALIEFERILSNEKVKQMERKMDYLDYKIRNNIK